MQKLTVLNFQDAKEYPKIVAAVSRILDRSNFVSPIELFTEMSLLDAKDVARWKRNEVQCLERIIRCNLTKAGRILRILRFHAHDLNLAPSQTIYKNRSQILRFSHSGEKLIEDSYSRHFVVVGKKKGIDKLSQSTD